MSGFPLDIAFMNYDRARPLSDGTVTIDGVDARFHSARIVPEIFQKMIAGSAYDVSELGMTYFLRTIDNEHPRFLALPVFPNRTFRHSAIYINVHKGIDRPEDLNGRTIGELAVYGHDAGVMAKGMLSDEFGFRPETCKWIVGGIDFPMKPVDFLAHPHPADVDVSYAREDADLGKMLEAGEIDALISADIPECILSGSPNVRRLFVDYEAVERDYFERTGIFPIMHCVAVKRALAEEHPEVIKAVYKGFCDAKQMAAAPLVKGMTFNNGLSMVPWLTPLMERNLHLFGSDWWPYGIARNRASVEAILRYHHEQRLTSRRFRIEDVFVDYLLES
jgi:hypothetical protein